MSSFAYPLLTWGFALVAAPVLIHLINLMRLRRVKWAAMDFLLKSYKKHRRWVWLKQLLLLLARMAALLLLVVMLARWDPRGNWLAKLQGSVTHHYVLLDDSYSMGETVGGESSFASAGLAIQRLALHLGSLDTPQKLTLLRFTRADRGVGKDEESASICDINAEIVDQGFDVVLEEKKRAFDVSELSVSPRSALELARQLIDNGLDEHRVIHVYSDFRSKDWAYPEELRESLSALTDAKAELRFVRCADEAQPNLGVTKIEPASDTRAAGLPLFVNVSIRNHGRVDATKVKLRIRTYFFDPDASGGASARSLDEFAEEAPLVQIDKIPAGDVVVRRVQVSFPKPGAHVVEAILPEDPIAADNSRRSVIQFPESEPVLIVDGDLRDRNAYYLRSIFQPGAKARTGVTPELQTPEFLREASPEELQSFHAVYLCDVDRLDDRAVKNLEEYVSSGGGLAIFAGPRVNFRFYNEDLYRQGEGMLPLPLGRDDIVPEPLEKDAPCVTVDDQLHPVFSDLLKANNPIIRLLRVDRCLAPPSDFVPPANSTTKTIASLHNGKPLLVEKPFGRGRVLLFMSTYAPLWNDMALGLNVILALKMQSYLAEQSRMARLSDGDLRVGDPVGVRLPATRFRRDVQFSAPAGKESARLVIDVAADKQETDNLWMASLKGGSQMLGRGPTDTQGVYEAWLATTDGKSDARRFALNVDPDEGDPQLETTRTLLDNLQPVKIEVRDAGDTAYASGLGDQANFDWILAAALAMFLVCEQLLAYSASYHPARGAVG